MFDKNYPNRKDWRKPYRSDWKSTRAKSYTCGCRNHGSCGYCVSNRTHKNVKRDVSSKEQLKDLN